MLGQARKSSLILLATVVALLIPGPAAAQREGATAVGPGVIGDGGGRPLVEATTTPTDASAAVRFLRDVGRDYVRTFSRENAYWYGGGAAASGLVHLADWDIRGALDHPLDGGATYGGPAIQPALALSWWIVGHAAGSTRAETAGRDLVRAQISAASWTSVLKVATNRTRPNGDTYSFPSGHASATFATATVLQIHYGWKLGAPMFAAATYTALSRISIDKHWASDVTFGAFVGVASARTVTFHVRNGRFAFVPAIVPGGVLLAFAQVR